jgi:hypothetical protein
MRYAGAPKAAIARLRKGDLGVDQNLFPWTGEFFLGLRLSEGLHEKEAGRFRVNADALPELIQDIDGWHIAGKLGTDDGFGRRRLVGCLATLLPPVDPKGASVLAGLFAGATLTEVDRQQWLEVPASDEAKALLANWTILFTDSIAARPRRNMLHVSPFYAALFADLMPAHSKQRLLTLCRPAMCPLLALLHWDWLYAPIKKGMRILPFPDALPFGCSRRTFYRHGWKRDELHWKAVHMGLLGVDQKLRGRMKDWFAQHRH